MGKYGLSKEELQEENARLKKENNLLQDTNQMLLNKGTFDAVADFFMKGYTESKNQGLVNNVREYLELLDNLFKIAGTLSRSELSEVFSKSDIHFKK